MYLFSICLVNAVDSVTDTLEVCQIRTYTLGGKDYGIEEAIPEPVTILNIIDYGYDEDGDGFYDYLVIEIKFNVTETAEYEVFAEFKDTFGNGLDPLEQVEEFFFNVGEHMVQFNISGVDIYRNQVDGPYEMSRLSIESDDFEQTYYSLHNTSSYEYTDFQRPHGLFTGFFSDYGYDEDDDGFYDYLVIEAEIDIKKAGNYGIRGELEFDEADIELDPRINVYLDQGVHRVQVNFSGIGIYLSQINGTYLLNLRLYARDNYILLDEIDYISSSYNYTQFQRHGAHFSGLFSDYGYDEDGNGLYDYLTIETGINVTKEGKYRVRYNIQFPDSDTYKFSRLVNLTKGMNIYHFNISGVRIYKGGVDGSFVLDNIRLYDKDYIKLEELYECYTTSTYNYTDFEGPFANFTGVFSDYGYDKDGDGLYDYLTIDVGINITREGIYEIEGVLEDRFGHEIEDDVEIEDYFEVGIHTVQLNFSGEKIYEHEVNGPYTLADLDLDERGSHFVVMASLREAYNTSYYEYTDFEHENEIPYPDFIESISDYGIDIDGNGLYDYLALELNLTVPEQGEIELSNVNLVDDSQSTLFFIGNDEFQVIKGNNSVILLFSGQEVFRNARNTLFHLAPFDISASKCVDNPTNGRICTEYYYEEEYISDYTTEFYNYDQFEKPGASFTGMIDDEVIDINNNGKYDYLILNVEINVTKPGKYDYYAEFEEDEELGYTTEDFEIGIHTIQIYISGPYINEEQISFPNQLHLKLVQKLTNLYSRHDEILVDAVNYTMQGYDYTEFESVPEIDVIGNCSDYGVDEDGDSLYDYLTIKVPVNVTTAGVYRVKTELGDIGLDIEVYLNLDDEFIYLNFSGFTIYSEGEDGQYSFNEFIIGFDDFWIFDMWDVDYRCYTQPYEHTDFQRPPVRFTGHYSDYGLDTNDNRLYDYFIVDIGLNVTKAGNYSSRFLLRPSIGGEMRHSTAFGFLPQGLYNLSIYLEGTTLYYLKKSGPYEVINIGIYDEEGNTVNRVYYPYITKDYDYTEFEHDDITCVPEWLPDDNPCLKNDQKLVSYTDINNCDSDENLPEDSETYASCDYCEPEWECHIGVCKPNGEKTISYEYTNNCCAETGLASDCTIPADRVEECTYSKFIISNVEVKIDKKKDKSVNNKEKISKEAEPGSRVKFYVEVENLFTREEDIGIENVEITVIIENIDDGDDLEEEANDFDLKAGRKKRKKISFDIPYEVDEDNYDVIINVLAEDENNTDYEIEWNIELDVEKEKHDLRIMEAKLSRPIVSCNQPSTLSLNVLNIGSKDEEDALVKIENQELGIDIAESFSVEEGPDDNDRFEKNYLLLTENAYPAIYPITITILTENNLMDEKTVELKVKECKTKEIEKPIKKEVEKPKTEKKPEPVETNILAPIYAQPVKKKECILWWCW